MPDVEFFCNWDMRAIMATRDPYLIEEAIQYKEDLK